MKRILIVTAVEAEKEAVLRGLGNTGAGDEAGCRFDVIAAGVGPAMAAASTATALAGGNYDLVISAGIGGGFAQQGAVPGTVVLATEMIAADLGAESPDRFISVEELGFGNARIPADRGLANKAAARMMEAGLSPICGPVLTVSAATGTSATAQDRASRFPGAAAEAMEGFGAATAARLHGIPALELRTVSNVVGPRDREAWRIPEALQALEAAIAIMKEVIA